MVFTKRLREGIRRGRIRCTIRIWTRLQVKVGGRYAMDDGHVVVDSIEPIEVDDITDDLSRESGFDGVDDLLETARHGRGEQAYLIRFHYLPPGAWDGPRWTRAASRPGGPGRPSGSGRSGRSGGSGRSSGSGRSGRSKNGR
jgi:uncharacterized membrane protein YgcG